LVERLVDALGLQEHVPEALGPLQVHGQQQSAEADERERQPIADAHQRLVLVVAGDGDEGGKEVGPGSDAAEVEIAYDPPAPRRVCDEQVHAGGGSLFGCLVVRLRNENSTPRAINNAAKMLHSDEGGTLRLGRCGSAGSRYVSGVSTSK